MHGLLLIHKESGMTSHDVVAKARRVFKTKAIGHTGTLDPMASGLMVLLIGEATKLSQYILEQNKAYRLTAELGKTTDTLDITGQVLSTSDKVVSLQKVQEEIEKLQGDLQLPVPIYSATKVDGKKLYEYAREDKPVEVPIKKMTFFDLKIENQSEKELTVFMRCSKGAFVRAWIHRLGEILGTGAVMTALERTESMPYRLEQATTLAEADLVADKTTLKNFVPMTHVLPGTPIIRIQGQDLVMMGNGMISHSLKNRLISTYKPDGENLVKIVSHENNELVALIGFEPGKGFVIRRVFRYEEEKK